MLCIVCRAYGVECVVVLFILWCEFNWGRVNRIDGINRDYNMDDARVCANQQACVLSDMAIYNMVGVRAVFKWFGIIPELIGQNQATNFGGLNLYF